MNERTTIGPTATGAACWGAPASAEGAIATRLTTSWARTGADIHAAQSLRWRVDAAAGGTRQRVAADAAAQRDTELFDSHCEHLLVHAGDEVGGPPRLVGTCRVLTPEAACQAGGYCCDTSFDLVRLTRLRPQLAELGHACIDPGWRHTQVARLLWLHAGRFLWRNDIEQLIVCAPLAMADGGRMAANVWNAVRQQHLAPIEEQVRPRLPLPVAELMTGSAVDLPPVVRSLLRCGAKLLGPPAWNAARGVAELPLMIRRQRLPDAWRQRFSAV
jgi:putative hemolysin